MKNVIINIEDSHEIDGEKINSELITVGTLKGDENDYLLTYNEQDEALKNCTTTLRVQNKNKIIMSRKGDFMTEMIIEKGKRHNCHYITPSGEMCMGIFASDIDSNINKGGGRLSFSYTVDFNLGFSSLNKLKVTVREVDKDVPLS
ncbi:MAG TPA: DUF1934 domain-containing protein [Clostridia bacterium]|nr:DUF1934 domain-containing protein [Clostridia bacterium]